MRRFRLSREQVRDLWGSKFFDYVTQEAKTILGDEPTLDELLTIVVGEILKSPEIRPCEKCGSVKNVHCFTIRRNTDDAENQPEAR